MWAKNNIPGYVGRAKDSTSIALTAGKEGQHAATKAIYELLENLVSNKGMQWYWLRDEFIQIGDAYDGVDVD